ncbi:WD40/YVTN/BNR-like repeat-containing protein [Pseudomonas sp. Q1-7]|uniref:WD40/YVTN/BNR-like repeat-containing protein n=1 Tax=Pseudomonas sp. Q1-7 TaxID=3020843 RepID=UPI0022FFF087|nr:YCF48-related protein [Pseudomonas sp. Q1-7]
MKLIFRPALALLCLLGTLPAAAEPTDRLERPSRLTPRAAQAPLTDLQQVGDQLVMVGESGHVLLRDAGGTLRQAQVPVDLLLTALHFVDERYGWAVGHDGVILHSADGGLSWRKQFDGLAIGKLMLDWAEAEVARLEEASAAAPDDEALSAALDNAYFAVDDARAGVEAGPSRPLLDVWFRNAEEGWVVGAYGMILHTTNGGQSWAFVSSLDNPERLHLNAVLGLADGSLLVAGEGGRLHRSNDGGQSWAAGEALTDASLYKLLQLSDGRVLLLGFGGALLSSADLGSTWQPIPLPSRANLYGASQLADGSLLLAGQGGTLLVSPDGERFRRWQAPNKAALLGVAPLPAKQLAVIGRDGLQLLPHSVLEEQLP